MREELPVGHSHAPPRLAHCRVHTGDPLVGVANDGQERVEDERDDGGPRADAADERQRDEESEQREARHRLEHVRHAQNGAPPRRPPREQDAQRHADHDRRTGRDRDQIQMLAYESQDFLRVPGVEFPEPHAAAMKARHSGLSDLRNSSGVPRNASRPCSMSPMRLPSSRPSRTSWVTKTMPLPSRPSSAANSRCSSTDRKSTRLNSSHLGISDAVFCLKKKHENVIEEDDGYVRSD